MKQSLYKTRRTRMGTLTGKPISCAAAEQRTGRIAIRRLKTYGISDMTRFRFMKPPPRRALVDAITDFYILGALDHAGCVTSLGKKVTTSLEVRVIGKHMFGRQGPFTRRAFVKASDRIAGHRCSVEIVTIVSSLFAQCNNIFFRPRVIAEMNSLAPMA